MARPASAALNDAGAMTSPSTRYPLTMAEMSPATRLSVVPRMIL